MIPNEKVAVEDIVGEDQVESLLGVQEEDQAEAPAEDRAGQQEVRSAGKGWGARRSGSSHRPNTGPTS